MVGPEDVYRAIEVDQLGHKLYLSSSYQCTERWTKQSLEFKVLMDFLRKKEIVEEDLFDRLETLAEKDFDKQYACPNDIPIYVYLTALAELNEPFSEEAEALYHKGCEIVSKVENLHWSRRHVSAWANYMLFERTRPTD